METTPVASRGEAHRFLNRLRYFAAMLHTQNGKGLTPRREVNLVALTALHHLGVALDATQAPGGEEDEADLARSKRIDKARQKHADPCSWNAVLGNGVGSPWPPHKGEREQFEKLSAGIHVSRSRIW